MYHQAWKRMQDANHIVIVSHVHPDGDTLGSALALYDALIRAGKKVTHYNKNSELPRVYDFLPGFSKIKNSVPKHFDLVVSCDCSTRDRLKIPLGDYEIINIDHHLTNHYFGDINLVVDHFSSAGMVVYELLKANAIEMSQACATCLYTAIADDTGFFQYGDMDEFTFSIVAQLVKDGANPKEIASKVKRRESLSKIRLYGYMLNHFDLYENGCIATIIFDKAALEATGAKREDTKNIVNMLRSIANVTIAIMILEEKEGGYKVSLRSKDINVSNVALAYQGGGHKTAAGFEVPLCDPKMLRDEIVEKIKRIDKE
ncbi:DHH family phosphoesterase [Sulfurospirillum multivorans]|uniref:Bifunctional oligoribonuclease and PAP phosphatase n=2 Tax=Sulfurospirillum multivorans TaxID=66821 RepID=A0AA86AL49_SULMK|nr:bifunctional oligoribonuclease/PAP phosphatase NrnA [Sulfurospirillum multivorans]AHJ11602.1 putative bifunctional oligoribonuclease and PAP phosphatase [Sulfurospirillum multivorans DSM 12446]QEH05102.1 putative bifunctional oligoribonuclease and PAP phosphatase [Sulfurospirillum multivorans]